MVIVLGLAIDCTKHQQSRNTLTNHHCQTQKPSPHTKMPKVYRDIETRQLEYEQIIELIDSRGNYVYGSHSSTSLTSSKRGQFNK